MLQTIVVADVVVVTADGGNSRWTMRPDQAEKMLATFDAGVGIAAEKISAGDKTAVRDCAAEYAAKVTADAAAAADLAKS